MTLEECAFTTERLSVAGWHDVVGGIEAEDDLARVVASMLTPAVTHALPDAWHGQYTLARAESWIAERDLEGQTQLVAEKTGRFVGLIIAHEIPPPNGMGMDVRLGYLLAEAAWGVGFGSELVAGFVNWCRTRAELRSITGGVATDNVGSARILEKNGFVREVEADSDLRSESIYRLELRP
jgi:ribosomal-protein-alanine N-acetyltransferase